MSSFTLSPSLGWPAGSAIAAVMLLFAVVSVIRHARGKGGDETTMSCARRALICLTIGAMALTPSVTSATTSRAVNNTDVVVAVDVTGSMAVTDAQYGSTQTITRLQAAKQAVQDLTTAYADSSFAALRFGASGTLDVPLTPDGAAINNWASTLAPEATSVSSGSSLDAPLDQLVTTLKSIRDAHPEHAIVLYLITDGEQTSSKARRSFSTLRSYLNDAFAVGVGSTKGGKIPLIQDGVSGNDKTAEEQWVTDPDTGQPGVSAMNENNIKDLADEMGGTALFVSQSETLSNGRSAQASNQWKVTVTTKRRTRLTPVIWPLAIALTALLAWEIGAGAVLSRRLL